MLEIIIGLIALSVIILLGVIANFIAYGTYYEDWENVFLTGLIATIILSMILSIAYVIGFTILNL